LSSTGKEEKLLTRDSMMASLRSYIWLASSSNHLVA
jgi:hypothetical protein